MNARHDTSNDAGLLSPKQRRQLREVARIKSEDGERRLRAMIMLRLHEGKSQREVAEWFDKTERTVRNLVRAFPECATTTTLWDFKPATSARD